MDETRRVRIKRGAAILVVLVLAAGAVWLWRSDALALLQDGEALRTFVEDMGAWGPVAIVALMALAIVMSPIPSGPIAVAAGAAFGPLPGALYVVVGSTLGALIAFGIARFLGFEIIERWSRTGPLVARLRNERSQTWLTLLVLAARLIPFVSFDAVSYVAGLTPLAFWRFALATFVGVVPVSFLLAYFGEAIVASGSPVMIALAVVVGAATLGPIAWTAFRGDRGDR